MVLENAGTIVRYTKRCFSSRLYWKVAVFSVLVSEKQGAIHDTDIFGDDRLFDNDRGRLSLWNLSVVLPFGTLVFLVLLA